MKVKTAELTGKPLDWALADALDLDPEISRPSHYDGSIAVLALPLPNGYPNHHKCGFFYTDPATCMGLIEQHKIALTPQRLSTPVFWIAQALDIGSESHLITAYGSTVAEAVARCVVQTRLGDEVDVPDELGVMS